MALPLAEEPGSPPDENKRKAFLCLVITLFVIDTIAIIGYLVLVYVLGWEGKAPLMFLLAAAVFTGIYFQVGKQKIDR
jgi:hypothetical protein